MTGGVPVCAREQRSPSDAVWSHGEQPQTAVLTDQPVSGIAGTLQLRAQGVCVLLTVANVGPTADFGGNHRSACSRAIDDLDDRHPFRLLDSGLH